MLTMVKSINEKHLTGLSDLGVNSSERLQVSCITCHRGLAKPQMLGDILAEVIAEDGMDAAEKKYDERAKNFMEVSPTTSARASLPESPKPSPSKANLPRPSSFSVWSSSTIPSRSTPTSFWQEPTRKAATKMPPSRP